MMLTWSPLSKPRGLASSEGCGFLAAGPSPSPELFPLLPDQSSPNELSGKEIVS